MIIANLPSFIGWILLYLSHSSTVLCLSNSMVGFGIGFSSIAKYSYTGEITEPRLRGRLASLTGISIMIGVSLIFVLESLFHWRSIALASVCFLIIRTCLISLVCINLLYSHLLDFRNACYRWFIFMPFSFSRFQSHRFG